MVDRPVRISQRLLAWYDQCKRELPWRQDGDPYRIWVSEVMLQQTRVEVVKEYYQRFMQRFPTLQSLADASDETVLRYWQGLGYYSRARNLHRGVQEIQMHYGGKIPDTREQIEQVPGIGPYIAGAILSMAYQQAEPAVDGNVMRVFSRLFSMRDDIMKQSVRYQMSNCVKQCMSRERPGDFNQALMDLGALVCVPRNPRCDCCCLVGLCEGFQQGLQQELPVKRPKKAPRPVYVATGLLMVNDRYLVVQRPGKGLLASMWQFPAVEMEDEWRSPEKQLAQAFHELGQEVEISSVWQTLTHVFSHRQWMMNVYKLCGYRTNTMRGHWLLASEFDSLLWAGPYRKIVQWCRK